MPQPVSDAELVAIRAAVEARYDEDLGALRRLVDIDCGTYTKAGVDEVGRWVEARMAALGAVVERVPDPTYGDALIGRSGAGGDGPTIVLLAHLDTVFEEGTAAARPFTIADGRATGPGVADMKSGLVAGLSALAVLREVLGADWPRGSIVFVTNSDEEIGSPAGTPVIERVARGADAALVLEAARPDGALVTARKGLGAATLAFRGRSAHAGVEPEKGRSAILAAAKATIALHRLADRWDDVTINVGVIGGGTRPNIVADEASLRLDIRATTTAHLDEALAAVRSFAGTGPDEVAVSVADVVRWTPMERTAAAGALFDHAAAIAGRLGFEVEGVSTGGASDGNTTAALGVPTLDGLGPVGGGAHAPDEYLELDSIVPRTTLLAALIATLDRGGISAADT